MGWLWALAAAILALLVWNFCSGPYLLNAVDHWTPWWITVVEWLNVAALIPVGVYAYQVFHRYIRALKQGLPQPHRGPTAGPSHDHGVGSVLGGAHPDLGGLHPPALLPIPLIRWRNSASRCLM